MAERILWREWSERAFAQAAAESRPVLLSLVTAWSDECAMMDRTTYRHPQVVSVISEGFIPVRVDADRRPDVNERYNLGGWPTTACLTSAGDVLSGGTYLSVDAMIALLRRVSDAWRARSAEILARASLRPRDADTGGVRLQPDQKPDHWLQPSQNPDLTAVDYFRALLIDRFDRTHGGFGDAPKLPHAPGLMLALALADEQGDTELSGIVEMTLDRIRALWDGQNGGFFRYADGADWSQPGTEKTLEDNAALLHVYVEAAIRRQSEEFRDQAAESVRWVKGTLSDQTDGGFFNAQARGGIDRAMYVDRNADMVSAFLRAAALFEDSSLRDFALKSLESVILPGYSPGRGVAHSTNKDVTGLLTDQIRAASALIWAHASTDQLPYSMLAAELAEFAIRTMWDSESGSFRDRSSADPRADIGLLRDAVRPFDINCQAACVLERLAAMTGEAGYHDRAVTILRSLAQEYRRHDLFGAPYALAIREVLEGKPPLGLELTQVDWGLG
jgi:uncharacterized protein